MAITYPLIPPAVPGTQKIKLSGRTQASLSQSIFTGSQQVAEWPGEWWELEAVLPPMTRANAEAWNAMFLSLRGRSGTFIFGDPGAKAPRGLLGTSGYPDILRYTQSFDNAIWTKAFTGSTSAPTVTADAVNDPNASLTADGINFAANSGGSRGQIFQTYGPIPLTNRSFIFSVWLRVASGTCSITLNLGDVNTQSVDNIVTVTTSWTRFSVACSFTGQNTQTIAGSINYFGTPSQTVYAWGAQIDRGSTVLAYSGVNNANGPRVNGAGQTGKTLAISFVNFVGLSSATVLKAGDYIMLGTGTARRLYKMMNDVVTDSTANATADIFPRLRESPADLTPIYWFDTRGTFRLQDNVNGWDLDEASIYGVNFRAIEAF